MNLTPGMKLRGHCNGYFGRDSYGKKLIIAVGTWDKVNWVVVEEQGGYLNFAEGFNDEDISNWLKETEEWEDD